MQFFTYLLTYFFLSKRNFKKYRHLSIACTFHSRQAAMILGGRESEKVPLSDKSADDLFFLFPNDFYF